MTPTNLQREIKYIDLFAGVGGFHYGIDRAYLQQETGKQSLSPKGDFSLPTVSYGDKWNEQCLCVYSNEWDKYANSVYRRHYGECDSRDIRTVKAEEIPDFDLLCGGFPCQAFSVAGKRAGFDDTRGTLFFEVARILRDKRPRYLVLENVKGLLSHDSGKTFQVILGVLSDIGYDVQWQVLNSKNFGVPQNRERVYIVGHLRGTSRPQVFPLGNFNSKTLRELTTQKSQGYRVYDTNGISTTIASQAGGIGAKTGLHANTIDANYYKGINTNPGHASSQRAIQDGTKIRRLTPTECERLQGFPDGWTALDADGKPVSDTQRYKMMGNAVTTNVVTEVVKRLLTGDNPEETHDRPNN